MAITVDASFYTASEKAKLTRLLAQGSYLAQRGRSVAKVDQKIEELDASARRREDADKVARERKRRQDLEEKAKRKAERKWW